MKTIRLERAHKDDGLLYCAYCEKPIVKAYDCIGHHVIHLTEENVNDVEISLNPTNVVLVHHKCHNRIHGKLSYSRRSVYLVYGPPMSGKSTWVNDVRDKGDLVVDINAIWKCISGSDTDKDGRLKPNVFGIRDKLIEDIKYRRGRWNNAYVIGGYPLISERERLCKELGAEEIFVECDRDECIARLIECNERDTTEWTKYIDDWFCKYIAP